MCANKPERERISNTKAAVATVTQAVHSFQWTNEMSVWVCGRADCNAYDVKCSVHLRGNATTSTIVHQRAFHRSRIRHLITRIAQRLLKARLSCQRCLVF